MPKTIVLILFWGGGDGGGGGVELNLLYFWLLILILIITVLITVSHLITHLGYICPFARTESDMPIAYIPLFFWQSWLVVFNNYFDLRWMTWVIQKCPMFCQSLDVKYLSCSTTVDK